MNNTNNNISVDNKTNLNGFNNNDNNEIDDYTQVNKSNNNVCYSKSNYKLSRNIPYKPITSNDNNDNGLKCQNTIGKDSFKYNSYICRNDISSINNLDTINKANSNSNFYNEILSTNDIIHEILIKEKHGNGDKHEAPNNDNILTSNSFLYYENNNINNSNKRFNRDNKVKNSNKFKSSTKSIRLNTILELETNKNINNCQSNIDSNKILGNKIYLKSEINDSNRYKTNRTNKTSQPELLPSIATKINNINFNSLKHSKNNSLYSISNVSSSKSISKRSYLNIPNIKNAVNNETSRNIPDNDKGQRRESFFKQKECTLNNLVKTDFNKLLSSNNKEYYNKNKDIDSKHININSFEEGMGNANINNTPSLNKRLFTDSYSPGNIDKSDTSKTVLKNKYLKVSKDEKDFNLISIISNNTNRKNSSNEFNSFEEAINKYKADPNISNCSVNNVNSHCNSINNTNDSNTINNIINNFNINDSNANNKNVNVSTYKKRLVMDYNSTSYSSHKIKLFQNSSTLKSKISLPSNVNDNNDEGTLPITYKNTNSISSNYKNHLKEEIVGVLKEKNNLEIKEINKNTSKINYEDEVYSDHALGDYSIKITAPLKKLNDNSSNKSMSSSENSLSKEKDIYNNKEYSSNMKDNENKNFKTTNILDKIINRSLISSSNVSSYNSNNSKNSKISKNSKNSYNRNNLSPNSRKSILKNSSKMNNSNNNININKNEFSCTKVNERLIKPYKSTNLISIKSSNINPSKSNKTISNVIQFDKNKSSLMLSKCSSIFRIKESLKKLNNKYDSILNSCVNLNNKTNCTIIEQADKENSFIKNLNNKNELNNSKLILKKLKEPKTAKASKVNLIFDYADKDYDKVEIQQLKEYALKEKEKKEKKGRLGNKNITGNIINSAINGISIDNKRNSKYKLKISLTSNKKVYSAKDTNNTNTNDYDSIKNINTTMNNYNELSEKILQEKSHLENSFNSMNTSYFDSPEHKEKMKSLLNTGNTEFKNQLNTTYTNKSFFLNPKQQEKSKLNTNYINQTNIYNNLSNIEISKISNDRCFPKSSSFLIENSKNINSTNLLFSPILQSNKNSRVQGKIELNPKLKLKTNKTYITNISENTNDLLSKSNCYSKSPDQTNRRKADFNNHNVNFNLDKYIIISNMNDADLEKDYNNKLKQYRDNEDNIKIQQNSNNSLTTTKKKKVSRKDLFGWSSQKGIKDNDNANDIEIKSPIPKPRKVRTSKSQKNIVSDNQNKNIQNNKVDIKEDVSFCLKKNKRKVQFKISDDFKDLKLNTKRALVSNSNVNYNTKNTYNSNNSKNNSNSNNINLVNINTEDIGDLSNGNSSNKLDKRGILKRDNNSSENCKEIKENGNSDYLKQCDNDIANNNYMNIEVSSLNNNISNLNNNNNINTTPLLPTNNNINANNSPNIISLIPISPQLKNQEVQTSLISSPIKNKLGQSDFKKLDSISKNSIIHAKVKANNTNNSRLSCCVVY